MPQVCYKVTHSMTKKYVNLIALALFIMAWGVYAATAAPGTIFGDPSEYQFIPAIWGIAHPPGYAFYTLLAGIWQRLVLLGSVAWRTNLLAGAAGAWAVTRVYYIALALIAQHPEEDNDAAASPQYTLPTVLAALFAGLALLVASDFWQHSIHANAHIVSVALTTTQVWLLVKWSEQESNGSDLWLYAFAVFAGLGVTHHPITVFGFPAYTLFILTKRPRILISPKTLALMVGAGLLGLAPWLYFPLRSPTAPFGPQDMATWEGFLRHATAQGLRVNLFHFGPADQIDRLRVFWTLLRLQYAWPLLLLLVPGVWALGQRRRRPYAVLVGVFLVGHLGFTLNSVQDVMAYLLHAFAMLAVMLGLGARALMMKYPSLARPLALGLLVLLLGTGVYTWPRISLRHWHDADAFILRLFTRFKGHKQHAAFVSDWEHLTPYFYHTYVEGQTIQEEDLRPVYVTAAQPWPESVFGNLPLGPVYLSNYRRDIRELGFRLRPVSDLWQVLEPPAMLPASPQYPLDAVVDGRLTLVGYDMPQTDAQPGDVVPIVIYGRVTTTQTAILMPYARLGNTVEQRWTTDSRRLTLAWQPGEIIAERYEIFIPYTLAPGTYPLHLSYVDMTHNQAPLPFANDEIALTLGTLRIAPARQNTRAARVLSKSLTNLGNDVALVNARARAGLTTRRALWTEPLPARPGQPVHLTLTWQALKRPRASYTVFIHLLDAGGQMRLGHDYTPLGGAFPSYLWFPKWLEGQRVIDPYRLILPSEIPPGVYDLEVGMYEMGSVRRIPQLAPDGTMTGDRLILGQVIVQP